MSQCSFYVCSTNHFDVDSWENTVGDERERVEKVQVTAYEVENESACVILNKRAIRRW